LASPEGEQEPEQLGSDNGPSLINNGDEQDDLFVPTSDAPEAPLIPTRIPTPAHSIPTTRSGRQVRRPDRLIETMKFAPISTHDCTHRQSLRCPKRKVRAENLNQQFLMGLKWDDLVKTRLLSRSTVYDESN
jgi:hypothetical protein